MDRHKSWFNIEFAEGQKYKLHSEDLKLLSNTGIWDLLEIRSNNGNLEPTKTYIPKYISTFVVFMHHLRGYEVNVKYLHYFSLKTEIDLTNFVKMLIVDNNIYKVHSMSNILEDIAFMVCPKILTEDQLANAKNRKSTKYKEKCSVVYDKICDYVDGKHQNMPYRYLVKKLEKMLANTKFEEFKMELNVKLPLVLITLVNVIGEFTGKQVSPNFEQNIKQRIRNDPDLANELYKKLTDTGILHTIQMIISCLSAFIEV